MLNTYENSEDYQIKSFVTMHLINTNIASTSYMTEWIQAVNEMKNNKIKYKGQGIKEFLVKKRKSRIKEK